MPLGFPQNHALRVGHQQRRTLSGLALLSNTVDAIQPVEQILNVGEIVIAGKREYGDWQWAAPL